MKTTVTINNFNAGEVSPKVDFRTEIDKYTSACRTMENMVPLVEGPATRMPGTYYVYEAKDSSKKVRLIEFSFSTEQEYVIELGEGYMRFYKDDGVILSGLTPYEVETPYTEDELFDIKYFQSADQMWFCHPDHNLRKLSRVADTTWYFTVHKTYTGDEMTITGITQADPGVVTCADVPTTLEDGDIVYLYQFSVGDMDELSGRFFEVDSVTTGAGGHFELVDEDTSGYSAFSSGMARETVYGTDDNHPACGTFFEQRMVLAGSNDNPQQINFSVSGDFDDFTLGEDNDDALQYTIASRYVNRIFWMAEYDFLLFGTSGGIWRAGASATTEAITPTNVFIKKLMRTKLKNIDPVDVTDSVFFVSKDGLSLKKVSYSVIEDKTIPVDMTRIAKHIAMGATRALSGIKQIAFQTEPLPIVWCVRNDGQLLGLTYEVQENVYAWFRINLTGSVESVAVIGDEDEEEQIWIVSNKTIDGSTVRHIEYFKPFEFFSDITDCFFVESGLSWEGVSAIVSAISNADPCVATLAAGHGVVVGDKLRFSGTGTWLDEHIVTAHSVSTNDVTLYTEADTSSIDSTGFDVYTSGGSVETVKKTLTGFDHLEGEEITHLGDGAVIPNETVASGSVTLDAYVNKYTGGLPFTATLEPMKLSVNGQTGATRTKKQKINKVVAAFYESCGGKYGIDTDNLFSIPFGTGGDPELHSEDVTLDFDGEWDTESSLVIIQDQPLPMTVLCLAPRLNVNDD